MIHSCQEAERWKILLHHPGFAVVLSFEEEVRDFCKGGSAHFKVPRRIRFVKDFPMTITRKLQKVRMRETEIERTQKAGAAV